MFAMHTTFKRINKNCINFSRGPFWPIFFKRRIMYLYDIFLIPSLFLDVTIPPSPSQKNFLVNPWFEIDIMEYLLPTPFQCSSSQLLK